MQHAALVIEPNRGIEPRSGAHLQQHRHARADELAQLAVDALIAEAILTPKPALVDQRGSGAHRDLDLDAMLRSARALREGFHAMAVMASEREVTLHLRAQLARIGREAEGHMMRATQGVNAHRGAIWVLGLLVAAKAMSEPHDVPRDIAALAARLAALPDRCARPAATLEAESHGSRVRRIFGVAGARGEAIAGFPHVIEVGLPALRAARMGGADETCARLDALMAIMSFLDDTCLLHRGGRAALDIAQRGARAVLGAGGASSPGGWNLLLQLDRQLVSINASPGGCADLLAACIFLDGYTWRK
jgi:triphosphoribosyl-dephospho-CoA synthase